MQQSIVRSRAMMRWVPATLMMPLMSSLARPVIVMDPEMMPATPQAAATVMVPLPPASSASKNFFGVIRFSLLKRLTRIASRIE